MLRWIKTKIKEWMIFVIAASLLYSVGYLTLQIIVDFQGFEAAARLFWSDYQETVFFIVGAIIHTCLVGAVVIAIPAVICLVGYTSSQAVRNVFHGLGSFLELRFFDGKRLK